MFVGIAEVSDEKLEPRGHGGNSRTKAAIGVLAEVITTKKLEPKLGTENFLA
jgi:hypothetical protein